MQAREEFEYGGYLGLLYYGAAELAFTLHTSVPWLTRIE